jgi:glutathione S-transferase
MQNMLEYLPNALACQMMMGLAFPVPAAGLGFAWALGRVIYALGYSTGDPKKRTPGSTLAGIVYLALVFGAGFAGYTLLTSSS